MDEIKNTLESMNIDAYRSESGLNSLVRILNIKPRPKGKRDIVAALSRFYNKPGAAAELFNRLSAYEKAILTSVVQWGYRVNRDELESIAETHNFGVKSAYSSNTSREHYFPKDSLLYAIFLDGSVPEKFRQYFTEVIPPYIVTFKP
ncbi:MAG: hypothetical protein LBU58_09700, partial [Clostridiales bacterium]|nr:hypothetical protein [Clostridiales bacterium]